MCNPLKEAFQSAHKSNSHVMKKVQCSALRSSLSYCTFEFVKSGFIVQTYYFGRKKYGSLVFSNDLFIDFEMPNTNLNFITQKK